MVDVIDFSLLVDSTDTLDELWSVACNLFSDMSVSHIFYRHLPFIAGENYNTEEFRFQGYSAKVKQALIDGMLLENDGLQQVLFNQSFCYIWLDRDVLSRVKDIDMSVFDLLVKNRGSKLFLIPVYGACHRMGYFSLGFEKPADQISFRDQTITRLMCNYIHMKYSQLLFSASAKTDILSKRELEIIKWVAKGKSNSVIGDIMGISRHTVDSYLRRIFIKLEATDRTTAALKALNSGLIF